MAHPLLEDILNEPALRVNQKKKSKTTTTLILLPPVNTLPEPPRTFDYLGKTIIYILFLTILSIIYMHSNFMVFI